MLLDAGANVGGDAVVGLPFQERNLDVVVIASFDRVTVSESVEVHSCSLRPLWLWCWFQTPLLTACEAGCEKIVQILLEAGATVNQGSKVSAWCWCGDLLDL